MKKLINILMLLCPFIVYSQQNGYKSSLDYMWMNVGNAGFSGGTAIYTTIRFSPDGKPYVAYADWGYGKNVSVMKYNGTDWVIVGYAGFSLMGADWISLAFSPVDGLPYVAFSDQMNYTKKASVMKFDGTNWIYVGTPSFSESVAEYLSLAFSPLGEPYVAFCDAHVVKASVMKFDGTNWIYVGNEGISEGMTQYTSLAFSPSGIPYVSFTEYLNNWKATVMKFNGANWENVGSAGFSAGRADYSNLAFSPSGQPYVAYSDGGNSDKTSVMKFDGTNWVNVGNVGFSVGWAFWQSLAFSPLDGQPYVTFGDVGNSSKASLMKFDGTDWVYIGSAGFSAGMTTYTNLTFSPSGVPYIVYSDNANGLKTTVMKYDDTGVGINETLESGLFVYPNPARDYISIEASGTKGKANITVTNLDGKQLITFHVIEPITTINVSTLPSGVYFVRVTNDKTVEVGKFVKQ